MTGLIPPRSESFCCYGACGIFTWRQGHTRTLGASAGTRHDRLISLFAQSDVYRSRLGAGGWALGFHSRSLAIYAFGVMLAFHLRVVFGEEPWLARTHGEKWERYKAEVPRWFRFHSRFERGNG